METHHIAWIIAGICSLLSVTLSTLLIKDHLMHYSEPRLQRYIVRVLLLIPVYTIDSFLSLLFKDAAKYLDLVRDCYEAYVIYSFFALLVAFADGENTLLQILEEQPVRHNPIPLCCVPYKPGGRFLHWCKRCILQYVIVKPILAVLAVIMEATDTFKEGEFSATGGWLWVMIIENIAVTLAMWFLILFHECTHTYLEQYKPLSKLLCVKALIFFSFWQGVVVAFLVYLGVISQKGSWTTDNVSTGTQDFLICCESILLCIAFAKTFGFNTYKDPKASLSSTIKDIGSKIGHVHHNVIEITDNLTPLMRNFADVANPKDVAKEALHVYTQPAPRYVVIADFMLLNEDEQKKRVVKEGWLYKLSGVLKQWKLRYFVLINNPKGLVYYRKFPWKSQGSPRTPKTSPKGYTEVVPEDEPDQPGDITVDITNTKYKKIKADNLTDSQIKKKKPIGFVDFTMVSAVVPMVEDGVVVGVKVVTPIKEWVLKFKEDHSLPSTITTTNSDGTTTTITHMQDWCDKISRMVTEVQNEPANLIPLDDSLFHSMERRGSSTTF